MSDYESYYQIRLLDDLHNYFPDILYGRQFDNNPLVAYIRSQAHNRFDLFTRATNNHNRNVIVNTPTQPPTQSHQRIVSSNPNDTIRITYSIDDDEHIPSSQEDSLLNPLASLITAALYPQTHNMMFPNLRRQTNLNTFMEPITIRPTVEQINNGSSIVEVTNNNDNCAICQDSLIQDGRRVRRLNICQHMFHDNCISTWFTNNVRCPTCRHDIRTN